MTTHFDVSTAPSLHSGGLRRFDSIDSYAPVADDVSEHTILVAEEDVNCRLALHHFLERSGYRVAVSNNVPSSLRAVFRHSADLVILDLGVTDGGSCEVLTKIRRRSTIPVIVCSDRASEGDRIRMLNLGADDFVAKPYSFAELGAPSTTINHGDLVVDRGTRTVTVADRVVTMTRKEFDLLAFLATTPGRVFSREDLLERVWGSTSRWQGRSTVTEHVRRIRIKIEEDPEHPKWITTVRGIGYRFCVPAG
jgi:two-component system, OmpR family, phosphate regulon response regulator PhoB